MCPNTRMSNLEAVESAQPTLDRVGPEHVPTMEIEGPGSQVFAHSATIGSVVKSHSSMRTRYR